MKIAFHVNHFTFRGSEVALYDYALYNRTILNNLSIIISPKITSQPADDNVLKKFSDKFEIFTYDNLEECESICKREKVNAIYFIKYGTLDSLVLSSIPSLIHCVFTTKECHGKIYAGVSESVSRLQETPGSFSLSNECKYPYVNHVVTLPDNVTKNYRKGLKIPENAIVFGRHGGGDTFNIPFVKSAIINALNSNPDIYFLFCMKPFMMQDINHKRIKYLEPFSDVKIKRKFINTCDAMIHACSLGESFGLSILEFSYCNKPVITWNGGAWHKQHLSNLGDKAIKYNDETELYNILNTFKKEDYLGKDWNVTKPFSPKLVMEQFKKVFLDPLVA